MIKTKNFNNIEQIHIVNDLNLQPALEFQNQKDKVYSNFAKNLQMKRKEYGITQKKLAILCNTSMSKIKHWEYNDVHIGIDNLVFLAILFNTPVEELIKNPK